MWEVKSNHRLFHCNVLESRLNEVALPSAAATDVSRALFSAQWAVTPVSD
jgi:hypothetical protein